MLLRKFCRKSPPLSYDAVHRQNAIFYGRVATQGCAFGRADMQELISVIIPVHNTALYLDACIRSVASQSWTNLEILLIDDGSTDESGAICDDWAAMDTRIRVIHCTNGGASAARNLGLEESRGELIGFVDSDDWCQLDMYERLYECIDRSGADMAMCGMYLYPHGPAYPEIKGQRAEPSCGFEDAVIPVLRRGGYYTSVCNKLYRRKALYADGALICMEPAICFGEDELWLFEVMRNCQLISFLPQPLYHYRYQAGSLSHTDRLTEKQLTIFEAKRRVLALLPQDEKTQRFASGKMYTSCFPMKVRAYCTGDVIAYRRINAELKSVKRWRRHCDDIPRRRQLKFDLMELEMILGLPARLVLLTDNISARKKEPIL